MGVGQSKNQKNIVDIVEQIAYKLISKQSWKDMQKMESKAECDKLIVITSQIFKKHLNDREIIYLAQRIQDGAKANITRKEHISWISKSQLEKLNTAPKRNRMCQGIAKFYIRIAHIYAAILKTINPHYVFSDQQGKQKIPLLQYAKLPRHVEKKLKKNGFCERRIDALRYKVNQKDKTITVNPTACSLIQTKYRDNEGRAQTKYNTLANEPGIPELRYLYKDIFDFDSGKFSRLSVEARKQYDYDLKTFYRTFTGKTMPSDITRFSQIKLRDYSCRYDHRIKSRKRTTAVSTNTSNLRKVRRVTEEWESTPSRDSGNKTLTPKPYAPSLSQHTPPSIAPPPTYPPPSPPPPLNRPPMVSTGTSTQRGGQISLAIRHKAYTGKRSSENFELYANHLARMIEYAKNGQSKLLSILDEIFVSSKSKEITINPKLNVDTLDKLTIETRDIIVKLFIKCEEDFRKGLQLFDEIIKEKELSKINSQNKGLRKQLNEIMNN